MTSIFGAMFSGISGLNAFGQSMGTIADNISNINTIGYKRTETRFSTLVTTPASATLYSPGGVRSSTTSLIDRQGLLQSSASPTDLAIIGDGFFEVSDLATAGTTAYTRAGQFEPDKDGNLKNTGGFFLKGYSVNTAGIVDTSTTKTVNIKGLLGQPVASTKVTLKANLQSSQAPTFTGPQDATTIAIATADTTLTTGFAASDTFTITVGPAGNTNVATFTFGTTTGQYDTLNELAALINAEDGMRAAVSGTTLTVTGDQGGSLVTANGINTPATALFGGPATTAATYDATALSLKNMAGGKVTPDFKRSVQIFDAQGTARSLSIAFLKTEFGNRWNTEIFVEPASATTKSDGLIESGLTKFNADGTIDLTTTGTTPALTAALTIPWAPASTVTSSSITVGFGTNALTDGITQFDSSSQLVSADVDGFPPGALSGIKVSDLGLVTAIFDSGRNQNIYKLPLATFKNTNALQAKTGNTFAVTNESGPADLRNAGAEGAGKISASATEASTVDLAEEFVNMIINQRAFTASGRIITTADEMLEELVRLKR